MTLFVVTQKKFSLGRLVEGDEISVEAGALVIRLNGLAVAAWSDGDWAAATPVDAAVIGDVDDIVNRQNQTVLPPR